ncbi:MAG: serine hydrolase, partial [Opitutaceae bacterium]
GQVARLSFLDPRGSIVQVEMSGSGAVTVLLENASGPAAPVLYNQSGISYVQGKPTIILAGADGTTHLGVYSVGPATNAGVTRSDVVYPGWADVAVVGIASRDGALGGSRQGNVDFNATRGYSGVVAPSVGMIVAPPVVVHDIAASAGAVPSLRFAPVGQVQVRIAGGDLLQTNASDIAVAGLAQVLMAAGGASTGDTAPAQTIRARLIADDGRDLTTTVVSGP